MTFALLWGKKMIIATKYVIMYIIIVLFIKQADKQTDSQTSQADKQTNSQTPQADKQTNSQTPQADKQTRRPTGRRAGRRVADDHERVQLACTYRHRCRESVPGAAVRTAEPSAG